MTEVLSQDEIDQLLSAINAESGGPENFRSARDCKKIRIYDFKRPDKFSKEQIRTMSILHETFSRLAASALTSRFKMPCHIHVDSVYQLTYEEFTRSIPVPAAMAVLNVSKPLENKIILEIDPAISFSFINRSFGGEEHNVKCQHELTRLEWVVIKDVILELKNCISEGWKQIIPDLNVDIDRLETSPQFVSLIHPCEMTILITVEARIGEVEGMLNICYPDACLNGVMEKLTAAFWYGGDKCLNPEKAYKLADRYDIPVEMTAEVFRRDYSIQKLLDLKNEELLLPLVPRVPNTCFLRFDKARVFQCGILADDKWFPKKIKIIGVAKQPYGTEGKMEMNAINPAVAGALAEAGITISVELGRTSKTVNEILEMGEGTIVELDKLAGEPVDIKANGILIARGEVVVIDENFGVRVIEIIRPLGSLNPADKSETE